MKKKGCVDCKQGWHAFHASVRMVPGEVCLVGSGRNAFLHVTSRWSTSDHDHVAVVSGAARLRSLARAILREVGG